VILPGTYHNGFAPRDGEPLFPELWRGCTDAVNPSLGPSGAVVRNWGTSKQNASFVNMQTNNDWVISRGVRSINFDGIFARHPFQPHLRIYDSSFTTLGRAPWTGMGWVSIDSFPTFASIVTSHLLDSSFQTRGMWIDIGPTSVAAGRAMNGTYDYTTGVISYTAGSTGWVHVAGSYDGDTLRVFYQGKLLGSTSSTLSIASCNTLSFGVNVDGNNDVYTFSTDGQMTDGRLYNRALSPQEIRLLASRRGIAYEMAPRRWTSQQIAAYRARYYAQVIGGGVI
jgi:hypothetical protein